MATKKETETKTKKKVTKKTTKKVTKKVAYIELAFHHFDVKLGAAIDAIPE